MSFALLNVLSISTKEDWKGVTAAAYGSEESRNPLIHHSCSMGIIPYVTFFSVFVLLFICLCIVSRFYSTRKGITLCLMLHLVNRRSAKILFTMTVGCSFP